MNELLRVGMESFIDVSSYRAHTDPFPAPGCLGIADVVPR